MIKEIIKILYYLGPMCGPIGLPCIILPGLERTWPRVLQMSSWVEDKSYELLIHWVIFNFCAWLESFMWSCPPTRSRLYALILLMFGLCLELWMRDLTFGHFMCIIWSQSSSVHCWSLEDKINGGDFNNLFFFPCCLHLLITITHIRDFGLLFF